MSTIRDRSLAINFSSMLQQHPVIAEIKYLVPNITRTPTRRYDGDAGYDLYSSREEIIRPGSFEDVHTDIAIALPVGYFGRITGRSSTVRGRGLLVCEGIIDNGFTGELFVGVWNLTDTTAHIKPGDRLAQLIVQEIVSISWRLVEELPKSERGNRGFGSTGS